MLFKTSHILFRNDIYSVRKDRGYGQTKLAKAIGIRRDEISILENGHRLPTKETLEKIKKELDCLTSDLYSLEHQKIIFGKI